MKTLSKNSPMIKIVKKSLLLLTMASVTSFAQAQESWSDSVPRVMKLTKNCPVKVRDKNGEWANFKDPVPVGRSVIGAINPRRPDLVFFQLTRDSKFMFLAPRSCFSGEEDWTVALEEEKSEGAAPLQAGHQSLFAAINRVTNETDGSASAATDYSLGFAFESLSGEQWYFGGGFAGGYGRAKLTVSANNVEFDDTVGYYAFTGFGSAYWDFKTLPYAVGVEPFLSYHKLKSAVVSADGGEPSASDWGYGFNLAWRFYWDEMTITPKFSMNFGPQAYGLQLQFAYMFGER